MGASENFLEILANYSDIKTVFLRWSQYCPNLIIQDYYPLTGSDLFCSWIETPGMIANQLPYDVVYDRTCNRNHSIAVQPQPLDPLVLHAKYIRQGWYWPNNGKSFPDKPARHLIRPISTSSSTVSFPRAGIFSQMTSNLFHTIQLHFQTKDRHCQEI